MHRLVSRLLSLLTRTTPIATVTNSVWVHQVSFAPEEKSVSWWRRTPPWWVESIFIAGIIGATVTCAQLYIEGERSDSAQRLENVRYVRDRSSKAFQERQFQDLDLRSTNLNGLHLNGADFTGADLRDAKLNFVDLGVVTGSQLPPRVQDELDDQAPAPEPDFPPEITGVPPNNYDLASSQTSSLVGAKLCGAQLGGSDLRMANLAFANLSDVDLTTTSLTSAILVHADLRSAKLSQDEIEGVIYDETTRWPDGFPLKPSAPLDREFLDAFTRAAELVGIREAANCG